MARSGLDQREKLLALVAGVIIGGFGLIFWVVQPLWTRIETSRSDVESKQDRLSAIKRLLSRQSAIQQQYAAVQPFLPSQDPEEGTTLLDDLQTEASGLGLQLNLKPRGLRSDEDNRYFELEVEVQGKQAAVLAYIDAVLRLQSAVLVERIRVNNAPTRDHQLKSNILLRQVLIES